MQASWLSYNVGRSIKGGKAQAADMKVAVLMGGQSGEHEVSLISGNSILEALQSQGFETIKVVISLDGVWTLEDGREVTIPTKALQRAVVDGRKPGDSRRFGVSGPSRSKR